MNVEGCEDAEANWEKGTAWAKYDPDETGPEELARAINEKTPFHASLPEKKDDRVSNRTPDRVDGSPGPSS